MTLPRWLPLAAIGALLALLAFGVRRDGFARDELRRLTVEADSLRRVSARVDTIYARDTLRLWRRIATVDTLRETLTLTDTLEVVRFIAAQDTAIRVCVAALLTCEQRVAVRDARLVVEADRYRALAATMPTRWERLQRSARDAAIGAAVLAVAQTALRR